MLSKLTATFFPRHLRHQLAWLSSLVLLITITVYAWYSANEQAQLAQDRDELDVVALAQNIAVTSSDAIILKNFTEIENLLVRTLALPHTLEVRITNARGRLLSHVARKPGGKPEVRFGSQTIDTPSATNAATRIDYSQPASGWRYQLGLGDPGRMVVWQPIFSGTLLGWVVVDHDVAPTTEIRKHIWLDSLIVGVIAITANILLLLLFLKRPMGALQTATNFAAKLDESGGAQLPVFHGTTEIESLTTALNIVSTRLFTQNTDLNNQKLALTVQTADLLASEEEIRQLNVNLERRVLERTTELQAANQELEAFSYSVSHDLRAPLRSIDGFSQAVLEDYADKLDDQARDYLNRVRTATQRMGHLIDDMLTLSRVTRAEMRRGTVDLSALAADVFAELQESEPQRRVDWHIESGLVAEGDAHLLRVTLVNLLGNAWKFTGKTASAKIEFGVLNKAKGAPSFFVRDNGAGYDISYADKLFGVFQRLHLLSDFPGTGIGLATVQRIVNRHGGRVWAEGAVGKGATFYFTL